MELTRMEENEDKLRDGWDGLKVTGMSGMGSK